MTNDNRTSVTMYLSNTAAQLKLQHYNTYFKKTNYTRTTTTTNHTNDSKYTHE